MNLKMITAVTCLFGTAAYMNYRRFVPKPQPLGGHRYDYETKETLVEAGEYSLYGQLLIPKGINGRLPTVIIAHGLGSNGKNTKNMAGASLAMSGYQVFCFDFRGGSMKSASGGKMSEMTVFTEKSDLEHVIGYIQRLDTTDPDNLFLLGESQGGFVSAVTASEYPQIKGLILYYPALCIPADARKRHGSKENIPETEHFGSNVLGRDYSLCVWDYDVYSVIGGYKGPVLIIHGSADRVVDISYGKKAAEVYDNAEFVELPGEIHGFKADGRRKAVQLAYDFMERLKDSSEMEEILTIHADLKPPVMLKHGIHNVMKIPFEGTAQSRWFTGSIQPGASDIQKRVLWKTDHFKADYTLTGTDCEGKECTVHIVNVNHGKGWEPTVTTDSAALDFLNHAACKAVLSAVKNQLTVRIYAEPRSTETGENTNE